MEIQDLRYECLRLAMNRSTNSVIGGFGSLESILQEAEEMYDFCIGKKCCGAKTNKLPASK